LVRLTVPLPASMTGNENGPIPREPRQDVTSDTVLPLMGLTIGLLQLSIILAQYRSLSANNHAVVLVGEVDGE
jgi:hypothetical protein